MKRDLIFLLAMFMTVSMCSAYTQWEDDGIAIRQETNLYWEGDYQQLSDGSSVIIWSDASNGEQELRAQRIDTDGNILWDADGVMLTDHRRTPFEIQTDVNSSDEVIISWMEVNSSEELLLCIQKIDIGGNLAWDTSGITIPGILSSNDCWNYKQVADNEGGAYLAWQESSTRGQYIFGLRLTAEGDSYQGWNETGNSICSETGYKNSPELLLYEGGIICNWNDRRFDDGDVFGQRMSGEGEMLWAEEGVSLINDAGEQRVAMLKNDSASGFLLCYRNKIGYNNEIKVQRFNDNGEALWVNSLYLGVEKTYCFEIPFLNMGDDEYQICWRNYLEGGLLSSRFNLDGNLIWDEPYETALDAEDDIDYGLDGEGGLWFIKLVDYGQQLQLQHINSSGEATFNEPGSVVFISDYRANLPRIIQSDAAEIMFCWLEGQNGNQSIYRQKVDIAGNLQFAEEDMSIYSRLGGTTNGFSMASNDEITAIAWIDTRHDNNNELYLQIVDNESGNEYFETNGLLVHESIWREGIEVAISEDGSNICIAGYTTENGYRQPMVQIVELDGNLPNGIEGIVLCTDEVSIINFDIHVSTSGAGYNIMWSVEDWEQQLYSLTRQRLENNELQWGENGICEVYQQNEEFYPSLEAIIGDYYIVINNVFWGREIYVRRFDINGQSLDGWEEPGIFICSTTENAKYRSAIETDQGLLVIWENTDSDDCEIYGQMISENGEIAWEEGGILLVSGMHSQSSIKVGAVDDYFIMSYGNFNLSESYIQKFNFNGEALWEEFEVVTFHNEQQLIDGAVMVENDVIAVYASIYGETNDGIDIYGKFFHSDGTLWEGIPEQGFVVCDKQHNQANLQVSKDSSNNQYMVWTDARGELFYESDPSIYMQKLSLPVIVATDETDLVDFVEISNYPNPFVGNTQLSYSLPRSVENAEIEIYNVKGQLVRKISAEKRGASWDCRDIKGRHVGSGVYFYRLIGDGIKSKTDKMILLR